VAIGASYDMTDSNLADTFAAVDLGSNSFHLAVLP
jgi:hypothetical protein